MIAAKKQDFENFHNRIPIKRPVVMVGRDWNQINT